VTLNGLIIIYNEDLILFYSIDLYSICLATTSPVGFHLLSRPKLHLRLLQQ